MPINKRNPGVACCSGLHGHQHDRVMDFQKNIFEKTNSAVWDDS